MKNYSLYLVPGFLTDKTIYKNFLLDERLDCKVLEFISPADKDESINVFADSSSNNNQSFSSDNDDEYDIPAFLRKK